MKEPSFLDRLRYAFDNLMSRGTIAMIGWLALVTLMVTLAVSVIVWLTRIASEATFADQFWSYLTLALDTDAWTDQGWSFRLAAITIAFLGIFVTSILVGLLATGIANKIEDLRKGRSRVIERGHTAVLGWSAQVFPIISELLVANENQPKSCIVILGTKAKVEMEEEIKDKVGDSGRTRIVCRRGNPMEMTDLDIVSLHTAKSIIILAPDSDDPDSSVIKTMLAITRSPDRRPEPYHIVAEIHDPKNLEVARIVGSDEVEPVLTGALIARITAQTCCQSGLSVAYTELLDFAGDEIYFKAEPGLVGKTFGEALLAYEDSAVVGLCPREGQPKLNPPMSTPIGDGDQIIAISEDDDTIVLSGREDLEINEEAIRIAQSAELKPEHTLILGWNWRAPSIVNELDHYVAPGSTATVVADFVDGEARIRQHCTQIKNQTITFQQRDTTDRRTLDQLLSGTCDHVILLPYSDALDVQQADARTLITLLHLRDIADHTGYSYSIVSEMLDIRNRNLAEVARADDFVVSDRLISLVMSQISENKALGAVFADLFDPEGSEIYLKPASDYIQTGEPVDFYTVVEAAKRQGETALGYRVLAEANDASRAYGVVLNPDKSVPVTFAEQDRVIVLAEERRQR
ncbi:MAG: potassium transporter TrkA [Anaerolineae bacterium]|nr:potassium transporter TrkA [Anaerolineae bacterium]NIN94642.1 potassium transporter TrkA [Anaerolineae bacterium]NIQ77702.1 potassium transporter TrkA [Anaerolineae bacterium]